MSMVFTILQKLFRLNKKPHIFLHAVWYFPDKGLKRHLRIWFYRYILKSVTALIVYGDRQKHLHSKFFKLEEKKFHVVPYHSTIDGFDVNVFDGDYIFAGGDGARDYKTLIFAAKNLPYEFKIAALSREHFIGIEIPDNIKISSVSQKVFLEMMANSAVIVVPLQKNLLQAGGQQTFLNAMSFGKPVIVLDDNSAHEYIQDGTDGIIVEPENIAKLKEKIISLMEDRGLRKRIGEKAIDTAKKYPPERYIREVLMYASEIFHQKRITS